MDQLRAVRGRRSEGYVLQFAGDDSRWRERVKFQFHLDSEDGLFWHGVSGRRFGPLLVAIFLKL